MLSTALASLHWHTLWVKAPKSNVWFVAIWTWNYGTLMDVLLDGYIERGYDYKIETEALPLSFISQLQ